MDIADCRHVPTHLWFNCESVYNRQGMSREV